MMASRPLLLGRMMRSERLVIALLRGSSCQNFAPEYFETFETLRRKVADYEFSIAPPKSPYIWQDEARLLARLASMQRQKTGNYDAFAPALEVLLHACAAALKTNGIWLDIRSVARSDTASFPAKDSGAPKLTSQTPSLLCPPHPSTIEARAICYVREKGEMATRDFESLGISRQILSHMTKKGLLRRVRHGFYAVTSRMEQATGTGQ